MSYIQVITKWLKSLSGLSSRLLHCLSGWTGGVRLVVFIALLSLVGCSSMAPLSLLTGGGPNVAANTQIGKTNNQGVNITTAPTTVPQIRPEAPVDTINQTNNNTEIDPLLLLLLILGWLAPSPNEIGRGILRLFKK
jgi:uncharacterized protein YceK